TVRFVPPPSIRTAYSRTGAPFPSGAVHRTAMRPPSGSSSREAVTPGVPGAPAGTAGEDEELQSLGSGARLCALTRTVYAGPLARPVHVCAVPPSVTTAAPDGGAGESSAV